MHAQLMSLGGFDEHQANQLIAKLPADKLQQIIALVQKYGPLGRDAIVAAMPQLLVGNWMGAVTTIFEYVFTHLNTLQAKVDELTAAAAPKDVTDRTEIEDKKEEAGKKPKK